MHEMIKRRKDEGFTLIELMIVIAVIGILAVVLVPKMSGIKTGAKITGVQTNAVSVQAYVTSRMDKWINKSTTSAEIVGEISAQFSGDNALKNPLSGKTTHTSNIESTLTQTDNGGLITSAAANGSLIAATDALQILSGVPVPSVSPYTNGHGTVVIVVPATATLATDGIQIIGYDDQGKIMDSILKVKP